MRTLLFSDVHLNAAPDGRETMVSFTRFLNGIDPAATPRIVVLGDLFDFWFEYRHVIFSGYFDVLRAFARLADGGAEIHFVCGNHDFWAGRFLRDALGFIIYPDGATLELDGRRVLLVHGDGLNPADRGYRVYKRIARRPWVVAAFRLLHPDWAMALAQGVSRGSRHMTRAEDVSKGPEAEALRAYAREQLALGEADVVVCGHAHHPEITPYPAPGGEGTYINTGDWLHHRSYVVWDGERFTSHRWEAGAAAEGGQVHQLASMPGRSRRSSMWASAPANSSGAPNP